MSQAAALITGAGRGIGRAIALAMGRGGPLVLVGRTESDLHSTAAMVESSGGRCVVVPGDVRDAAVADRARRAAEERGWHVEHLVCNAGIGKGGALKDAEPSMWRDHFEVNVFGVFNFVRAFTDGMIERGRGTIVIISSIAGLKGYAYTSAYSATKHAQLGLARSLAQEVGTHGIVVVPICPSYVDTEMTLRSVKGVMNRHGIDEAAARERIARTNPQRRIVPPEEVAEMVVFVCSHRVPSLHGNPIIMSGGEQ